jgi:hypothetical protein
VTNSASAKGSFNNQPVISPQTVAIAFYKHPTDDRAHNSESNNGDYGRYYGPNYGTVFVPVPMMYSSEHYGKTNIPNSDSKGHKAKAHLSKHKNHYKHHKTGKKSLLPTNPHKPLLSMYLSLLRSQPRHQNHLPSMKSKIP